MAQNYVLLERIELNASAASVTFSNIPQSGYTDLKVVISARGTASGVGGGNLLSINGSSGGTNFTCKLLQGNGGIAASGSPTNFVGDIPLASATASTFGNIEITFPNYTSSNYKSYSIDSVTENNASGTDSAYADLAAGLWSQTTAISSLGFSQSSGSFVQYSTFSLYGLAALGTTPVIAPKASGGNITTDGTYWYHTFLATGAFVPFTNLTCDALVVAGGGGSGGDYGGAGGGAGGLLGFTSQSLTSSTSYTATIGAGGTAYVGGQSVPRYGGTGSNSQLGSLTTALGGGGGASDYAGGRPGQPGGSGGGGSRGGGAVGTGTAGQGNNGGTGYDDGSGYPGGGGGGAGAVGQTPSSATGGNGGVGATYNTTVGGSAGPYSFINAMGVGTNTGQLVSSNYYYAGGGAGGSRTGASGTGGSGGGGASNTAGTRNTGGGGGGANGSGNDAGFAGGSGIVIIRYTIA
jgi:hypothetical protein